MSPKPSLALAQLIAQAYRDDDFLLVVIHGPLRMGKSAYAMKVMGQVYDYLKGRPLSADLLKDYMGFHPREVVYRWARLKRRIPCYLWDDAGYWLYSMDWWHPLLKSIQKYLNVIGTDMNTLILTTPDPRWILKKLLHMPGAIRGKVMKRRSSRQGDSDSLKYSRRCKGYKPYLMPDLVKSGVNSLWVDDYSCKIPQDVYDYYLPLRISYAKHAKTSILDEYLPDEMKETENILADLSDNR